MGIATTLRPKRRIWYGVMGNDGTHYADERAKGVRVKCLELGWDVAAPTSTTFDSSYFATRLTELNAMRAAGFQVVIDPGFQYPPAWAKTWEPFKDQYANTDANRANLIWSATLRAKAEAYIDQIVSNLGTDWFAIRVGSGAESELVHRNVDYFYTPSGGPSGTANQLSYGAYSVSVTGNPVPGFVPGGAFSSAQATSWYSWYVDTLCGAANWQQTYWRGKGFGGSFHVLMPGRGWALNPADEGYYYGNIATGYAFANRGACWRLVTANQAGRLTVWPGQTQFYCSSWGEDDTGLNDASANAWDWSSGHIMADRAQVCGVALIAENPDSSPTATLARSFVYLRRYRQCKGLMWVRESQLYTGGAFASIAQLATKIATMR